MISVPGEDYTETIQQDHAAYARHYLKETGYDEDYEVVIAERNQLMLDYDRTTIPLQFYTALGILHQAFKTEYIPYEVSESKSGNKHVIITLPRNISDYCRVAWQAAFGSDPKREALHLLSLSKYELNPILLYNKKKPQLSLNA
jgi:hypothetical protein